MPNEYSKKVYAHIQAKNGGKFPISEQDFINKIESDDEYAKKVYAHIQSKNEGKFPIKESDFIAEVKKKDKSTSTSGSEDGTKSKLPENKPAKPKTAPMDFKPTPIDGVGDVVSGVQKAKIVGEEKAETIKPEPAQQQQPQGQGPKLTNFEKRIQNPALNIKNKDGSTSTHKMMSWESDGKYFAAPTIVEVNGRLKELKPDEAIDYAFKNNEFKQFKTDKEAKDYADNGYKQGTTLDVKNTAFAGIEKAQKGAQEQLDLEAKITAPQPKPVGRTGNATQPIDMTSFNKKYGQLSGIGQSVGGNMDNRVEDKTPIELKRTPEEDKLKQERDKLTQKAIAKGITTEQYKKENFDKAANNYVSPEIKAEYETYTQIDQIKKDLAAYKAEGNTFQAEVAQTKLEAAQQKLDIKKANTDRKIDSRIAELTTLIDESKKQFNSGSRGAAGANAGRSIVAQQAEYQAELDNLKFQKQAFFKPLEATIGKMAEFGVKVDSWDQIKEYYATIQSEYEDLLEKNPIAVGTVGKWTGDSERVAELYNQVRTLAPIVLANRTPSNEDDPSGGVFGKTALQTLIPSTKGLLQTQAQVAQRINQTAQLAGVNPNDINLPVAEALEKQATYEPFSSKDWESMGGLTTGMLTYFAFGGNVVGNASKVLQAEKVLAKIVTNPKAYKWAKYIGGAVKTGLEYEAAGLIAPHLEDEASFASGFLGAALSKPAEKLFNKIGGMKILQNLFKENAQEAVDIFERVGRLVATGTGETIEEYGNEFGNLFQAYATTGDAEQLRKDIDERFGTVSKNFHFAVMSFVMGAGMGVGNAFGSYSTNEAKKAYNNLSEEEKGKFDEFVGDVNKDIKKATEEVISTKDDVYVAIEGKTYTVTPTGEIYTYVDDKKQLATLTEEERTTILDRAKEPVSETPSKKEPENSPISVGETIDKPSFYKGEKGKIYQDGQTLVFKVEGQEKEYELGNVDEVKDKSITEFDIETKETVVTTNEQGGIVVRDKEYVNNYSDPLAAINRDKEGNVVSVNLETPDGKKRTFRGNIGEDIAYQIHLKEINKDNETRTEFEQHINEDEGARSEIDNARLSEPTKENANEDNAAVPREKIQPIVAVETPVKEQPTTPTPNKIKVLGKEVNVYNDYIPSKVEDVEPDAMYSFNADSKDGIPSLLHDVAYANKREVNGVKSENWHASISGEELLKLYPKEQPKPKANIPLPDFAKNAGKKVEENDEDIEVDIDTYLAANPFLTEFGKERARAEKHNETAGKQQARGAIKYLDGEITAKEYLTSGEYYHQYLKTTSDGALDAYAKEASEGYKALYDKYKAKSAPKANIPMPDFAKNAGKKVENTNEEKQNEKRNEDTDATTKPKGEGKNPSNEKHSGSSRAKKGQREQSSEITKAQNAEPNDVEDRVIHAFLAGMKIQRGKKNGPKNGNRGLWGLFSNDKELAARIQLTAGVNKGGLTIEGAAESIWEDLTEEEQESIPLEDLITAVETVLINHSSRNQMAITFNQKRNQSGIKEKDGRFFNEEGEEFFETPYGLMNQAQIDDYAAHQAAQENGKTEENIDDALAIYETLTDEELDEIAANKEKAFEIVDDVEITAKNKQSAENIKKRLDEANRKLTKAKQALDKAGAEQQLDIMGNKPVDGKLFGTDIKALNDVVKKRQQEVDNIKEELAEATKEPEEVSEKQVQLFDEVTTKKQIESFGVPKSQVNTVYSVIDKVVTTLNKAGLTVAKTVAEWVTIDKGEESSSSLKQIIGELGVSRLDNAKKLLDNLSIAKQMEESGKTPKEIHLATSWEKGTDKKWRYEIIDFNNLDKNNFKNIKEGNVTLYDLIGDSELFKAYPELKDLKIKLFKESYYSHNNKTIYLADKLTPISAKTTIIHETQHAIQAIEGFTFGTTGSREIDSARRGYYQKIDLLLYNKDKKYRELVDKVESLPAYIDEPVFQSNPEREIIEEQIKPIFDRYLEENPIDEEGLIQEAKRNYLANRGEVEARNAETRMRMTAKERKATMLSETEDISTKDRKILQDAINEKQKENQPLYKEAQAQYRVQSGKNIVEALQDFDGSPKATVALTHEIMHPTVVAIFDGAKEGNPVGEKHANTIVSEYNKANPDNQVTVDEMVSDNDAFKSGKTTENYRAVQEFIAESWEKYHTEGSTGFSKAFQDVLNQISEVFKSVYASITNTKTTPELRKMFDEILGKEELPKPPTTRTQKVRLKIKDTRDATAKKAAESNKDLNDAIDDLFKDNNFLNSGFNPEQAAKALKVMYKFIELKVYKFEDIILTLIEKIPLEQIEEMWEYLKDAYAGAHRRFKDDRSKMTDPLSVDALTIDDFIERNVDHNVIPSEQFIDGIKKAIANGQKMNYPQMRKLAEDVGLIDESIDNPDKLIQELAEAAIIDLVEVINDSDATQAEKIQKVEELYNLQPSFTMRSSERVMLGQFSTPITISFGAGEWINAFNPKSGLEPSAGNGMMLSNVRNRKSFAVNEIDTDRNNNLSRKYDNVSDVDAANSSTIAKNVDAVVMNPPFGSSGETIAPGMEIDTRAGTIKNIRITGVDKTHVIEALKTLAPNGAAAIVINGHNEYNQDGRLDSPNDWHFMTYLHRYFNVVDVINVSDKMYSKQGTTVPVRMILIKGRRNPDNTLAPKQKEANTTVVNNSTELINRINEAINLQQERDAEQMGSGTSNGNGGDTQGGDIGNNGSTSNNTGGSSTKNTSDGKGVSNGGQQPTSGNKRVSGNNGNGSRNGGVSQGSLDLGTNDKPDGNTQQPTDTGRANDKAGSDGTVSGNNTPNSLSGTSVRQIDFDKAKQPYISNSEVPYEIGSVIPTGMAQSTHAVLSSFKDIDAYVSEKLGWTKEQLGERLSKEQVDSVALAIYNIEKGESLVIGDMTGVGKGRQAAAIMTYAMHQGMKPVFVTQSAKLFSDFYRDLKGIGSEKFIPFIMNSHTSQIPAHMYEVDKSGTPKVIHSSNVPNKADIISSGDLDGYDYVVATYSQFNTSTGSVSYSKPFILNGNRIHKATKSDIVLSEGEAGYTSVTIEGENMGTFETLKDAKAFVKENQPNTKRAFMTNAARGSVIVMDESHLAAGTGNTNQYFMSLLGQAKGVTYLSATSMKTPSAMVVYAMKNAIGRLNFVDAESTQAVIDSIINGGVAMQEIVSRGLTQIGQMIRRERDMEDRPLTFEPIKEDKEFTKEKFNEINEAFLLIDEVSQLVKDIDLEAIKEEDGIDADGGDALGVNYTPFASKMFNMINQLLMSLKAEAIAEEAITEIKNGRKPIIAVNNTNETFLNEVDAKMGERVTNPNFSWILKRALRNTLKYTIGSGKNTIAGELSFDDLSETTKEAYRAAEAYLNKISSDLHLSPIDQIKNAMEARGYSIGELTGRSKMLDKDNVLRNRERDDIGTVAAFQNGDLDALLINRSASTGISLHADKNAKDQKQRVLLIAQAQLDINQEIQVHGRNDRTGQVKRGAVKYLYLSVPAEQRLFMMLQTKLKSLLASTTSSGESDVDAPDMINKYGDLVATEVLVENPQWAEALQDPINSLGAREDADTEKLVSEGNMDSLLKKLPFAKIEVQEKIFADITERYNTLIEHLNENGENDLMMQSLPLNAETIASTVAVKGEDNTNPFGSDTNIEIVEVDSPKKPMTSADIDKEIENLRPQTESLRDDADKHSEEKIKSRIETINKSVIKKKEKAKKSLEKQVEKEIITKEEMESKLQEEEEIIDNDGREDIETAKDIERYSLATKIGRRIGNFKPGNRYLIPIDFGDATKTRDGVFLGFKYKTPIPSQITAVFATSDGRRTVTIPLSQTQKLDAIQRSMDLENWDSMISRVKNRNGRVMITGNLMRVFNAYKGSQGKFVSYTTKDGQVKEGYLLPESVPVSQLEIGQQPATNLYNEVMSGQRVTGPDLTIQKHQNTVELETVVSKQIGGKYYANPEMVKITGSWRQSARKMFVEISADKLGEVLTLLESQRVKLSSPRTSGSFPNKLAKHTGTNMGEGFVPTPEVSEEQSAYDKLADNILKGRINKPGQFQAGTGFSAVWDLMLDVIAAAVRQTGNLVKAVEAGLETMRDSDWYKDLSKDEQEYQDSQMEEYLTDSIATEYVNELTKEFNTPEGEKKPITEPMGTQTESTFVEASEDPNGEQKERVWVGKAMDTTDPRTAEQVLNQTYNTTSNPYQMEQARKFINAQDNLDAAATLIENEESKLPIDIQIVAMMEIVRQFNAKGQYKKAAEMIDRVGKLSTSIAKALQAHRLWNVMIEDTQSVIAFAQRQQDKNKDKAFEGNNRGTRASKKIKKTAKAAGKAAIDSEKAQKAIDKIISGRQKAKLEDDAIKEKLTERKAEKTKSYFNKWRVDTKGKNFDATLGIPIAIWNTTIDAIEAAYMGGLFIEDAIKAALDKLGDYKDTHGKKFSEKFLEDWDASGRKRTEKFVTPNKSARQQVKDAVKDLGVKISEIVGKHYDIQENTKKSLKETLIEEADLTEAEAENISRIIEEEFEKAALAKLKNFEKKHKGTNFNAKKLIEAVNAGNATSQSIDKAVIGLLGLDALTEAEVQEIKELTEKAQNAPAGFQRQEAITDLTRHLYTLKGASLSDVLWALWYSSILSGFTTFMKNGLGNLANIALEGTVNTLFHIAAGTADILFTGNPTMLLNSLTWTLDLTKGMMRGSVEAYAILTQGYEPLKSIKHAEGLPSTAQDVLEMQKHILLKGKINPTRLAKYVKRIMVATDAIAYYGLKNMKAKEFERQVKKKYGIDASERKALIDRLDTNLEKAKEEVIEQVKDEMANEPIPINLNAIQRQKAKLDRAAKAKRRYYELIDAVREKQMPGITDETVKFAARATYNYDPEGTLGYMSRLIINAHKSNNWFVSGGAKILIPFVRIVANVTNQSLDYTPWGFVRVIQSARGSEAYYKTREERQKASIKAGMGLAITAGLVMKILSDLEDEDKEPWFMVTADGHGDSKANQVLYANGWKPYSVTIGGITFDYRYTPLAIAFTMVGHIIDAKRYKGEVDKDMWDRTTLFAMRTGTAMFDMSYLSSVNGFMALLEDGAGQGDKISKWVSRSATSPIPNFLRSIELIYNKDLYDKSDITSAIMANIPFATFETKIMGHDIKRGPVRYNIFGQKIQLDGNVEKLFRDQKTNELAQFLIKNDIKIRGVSNKVGDTKLTPEEYELLKREIGSGLYEYLDKTVDSLKNRTKEQKQDKIDQEIDRLKDRLKPKLFRDYYRKKPKNLNEALDE